MDIPDHDAFSSVSRSVDHTHRQSPDCVREVRQILFLQGAEIEERPTA
jgi:hypothetical protein